jgi:heavy metal efflux system protein
MIANLVRNALAHRWGVLVATVIVAGMGVWAYMHQKVDAYPDISAEMVLVITEYPGRAPEEVELQVTLPIEIAMRNVPRVEVIRSRTIFGLSEVQLVFEDGVESYWARQRVQERLATVELPEEATTELGPLATAYGEIYRYELRTDGGQDLMELRTLNDWVVIPRLMRVPGVAEVSNFGGLAKQFSVTVDPFQLERFNLSVADIVEAIQANHANAGGNVMHRGSMSFVIRGRGVLVDLEDIRSIYVESIGGTPIYIRDVATVELDHMHQAGIFSKGERSGSEGHIEDRPDSQMRFLAVSRDEK